MSYRYRAVEYLNRCKATTTPGKFHSIGDKFFACRWDGNVDVGEMEGRWKCLSEDQFIEMIMDHYITEDLNLLTNG